MTHCGCVTHCSDTLMLVLTNRAPLQMLLLPVGTSYPGTRSTLQQSVTPTLQHPLGVGTWITWSRRHSQSQGCTLCAWQ
jgi:hypothetical protein